MASRFANIYFIRNNGGTYEAWKDNEASATYSGTDLVADVLNSIETAHSSGGFAVLFGVGTFDMGTSWWTLNTVDDVLIAGMGIDTTVIANSTTAASDSEPFSFTACDRITIRDLTISAGGTARSTADALDFDAADDCLVERVKIVASRASGIVFDGKESSATGNVIRDCIVTGTQGTSAGHGIKLLAADRNLVTGCVVHDTAGDGIQVAKASSGATRPNAKSVHNIVQGNRVYNAGRHGIEIVSSDRNIIQGNIVDASGDDVASVDGIRITGADSITADHNIFRDNISTDTQGTKTQRYGVNIGTADANDNTVIGNYVEGNNVAAVNDLGVRTRYRHNKGYPDNAAGEVSSAYSLTLDDPVSSLNVVTSGGSVTITLPDNSDAVGRVFVIRREGANTVIVTRAGSDTIDGSTTKTLSTDGAAIGLMSVGDNVWKVVSTAGTVT